MYWIFLNFSPHDNHTGKWNFDVFVIYEIIKKKIVQKLSSNPRINSCILYQLRIHLCSLGIKHHLNRRNTNPQMWILLLFILDKSGHLNYDLINFTFKGVFTVLSKRWSIEANIRWKMGPHCMCFGNSRGQVWKRSETRAN